jgi:hypothetical protein
MKTISLRCILVALTAASAVLAAELKPVDVQFMLRGYCYAGSRPDKDAPGGYGPSENMPKQLGELTHGRTNEISLVALPEEVKPFGASHSGFRLLLINRTRSELVLAASDSRIAIVQEALDEKGQWRPVEYLPSSWCGNSYHRVFLPAGHYWEFSAPRYSGTIKTKLRFVLQGKQPVYSNVFDGTINAKQFTVQQGHRPTSIMDPYNN